MDGKIQAAIGGIHEQETGDLYIYDIDTKTRQPVLEVLKYKTTLMMIPDLANIACRSFEEYTEDTYPIPLEISEEDVH